MSQINVDNIKNRLGSGAPSFPNGIDVSSGVTTFTNGLNVGTGASVFSPGTNELALGTNSAERVRINSSGNIGIGTVPQSWSGFRSLQLGGTTSIWSVEGGQAGSSFYSNNIYYDGSNRRYLTDNSASEYVQDASTGNHIFYEASSGTAGNTLSGYTEIARFTSNGLKVPSGLGIDFSANGNAAGMTSELLDDYEEGTWTPSFYRAGTTRTHSLQTGYYTKVGNKVTVTFEVELSSFSQGGSGQYSIQGLPFSSDSRGNYGGCLDVWGGVTLSSGYTNLGLMANGSSTIFILMQSSNNGGAPDTSGVTYATSNLIFRGQFNYWSGS